MNKRLSVDDLKATRPQVRTELDPDGSTEWDHRLCVVIRDHDGTEYRIRVEAHRALDGAPYLLLDPVDDTRLEGDAPGTYHLVKAVS